VSRNQNIVKILSLKGYCSIQDYGRPGFRQWGIPPGGCMDAEASGMANALLGNPADSPLLELAYGRLAVEFLQDWECCVTGGVSAIEYDNEVHQVGGSIFGKKGKVLVVHLDPRGGYGYLALRGGILSPEKFGSSSYHPAIGMKTLEKGAVLVSLGAPTLARRFTTTPELQQSIFIKSSKGPEFNWLSTSAKKNLFAGHFRLTEDLSRVGFRLHGPTFHEDAIPEMISSPTIPGVVQLPPSGQLIVFMRDAPTSGGYPRILIVEEEGIDQLARKKVGDIVKFVLGGF